MKGPLRAQLSLKPVEDCTCNKFLDPYPSENRITNPLLVHYCKVCNIQLNSCRQAEIHSNGKKHQKRFECLSFTIENCSVNTSTPNYPYEHLTEYSELYETQTAPVLPISYPNGQYATQICPASYLYANYVIDTPYDYHNPLNIQPIQHQQQNTLPPHVLQPPPSYSQPPPSVKKNTKKYENKCSKSTSARVKASSCYNRRKDERSFCDVCRLTFPSKAVLDNHVLGSRHSRKVKSQEVFRQLQDSGAEFSHDDSVSEIRCKVCQVLVNSSHQLQAHLSGHKHKGRASRQALSKGDSSSHTSTTVSEDGFFPSATKRKSGRRASADYQGRSRNRIVFRSLDLVRQNHHRSSGNLSRIPSRTSLNRSHSKSIPAVNPSGTTSGCYSSSDSDEDQKSFELFLPKVSQKKSQDEENIYIKIEVESLNSNNNNNEEFECLNCSSSTSSYYKGSLSKSRSKSSGSTSELALEEHVSKMKSISVSEIPMLNVFLRRLVEKK